MVLRLLTMVVIRRVPNRSDEAVAPVPAGASAQPPPVSEPEPELVAAAAAAAAVSEPVVATRARLGSRRGANGPLYRIHHHRMLLGVPVLAAIFASGAWLGDSVGGQSSADAATVTVHLKGKIIRVAGSPVAVRVPGQTVHVKGHVVRVPGTTVQLPPETHTVVSTINDTKTDSTTITTTVQVPTTLTETTTDTATVTETTTVTTATTSAPTT
jgi:hypothetical protein